MSENLNYPNAHLAIWDAFADPEYRHAFNEGHVADFLASQIFSLRADRSWSQAELAERANLTQPQISIWEASCDGLNLSSLFKLSIAFDVALMVKFVPFSELARDSFCAAADKCLPSFSAESAGAISYIEKPAPFSTRERIKQVSRSNYITTAAELSGTKQAEYASL